jgi:ParB family transcriptional regulator, chromosome partitioning protein
MSKKLAAKASLIQMPPAPPAAPAGERTEPAEPRVKTAPGSMAHFMAAQSAAVKEAEDLRDRLKAFDGARPVRLVDPATVRPSRWANRHEDSYADSAFADLKAEIASAGVNVQPVSVRALPNAAPGGPAYELVFGHRRHRACLELGLAMQAMVVELNDQELFEAMERENRARKNLSAWEQGTMYKRALDEGLYPSQRKLSEALGVDVSLVSKSLSLARLPPAVVGAFGSPLEIQFRWAQPLADALQRDPDAVIARAQKLKAQAQQPGKGGALPAAQVLAALLGAPGAGVLNRSTPGTRVIHGAAGRQAVLVRDARGRVTLKFAAGVLGEGAETELAALVEKLLSRP